MNLQLYPCSKSDNGQPRYICQWLMNEELTISYESSKIQTINSCQLHFFFLKKLVMDQLPKLFSYTKTSRYIILFLRQKDISKTNGTTIFHLALSHSPFLLSRGPTLYNSILSWPSNNLQG